MLCNFHATRVGSNFNLDGQELDTTKNAAGWLLGAASVKETYDDGDIVEIVYYALKPDGTWFAATSTPDTPQPPGAGRNYTIDTAQGCGGGACHAGDDFVPEGNAVAREAALAPPNPYVAPLISTPHSRR